jgi:hypothetical protein
VDGYPAAWRGCPYWHCGQHARKALKISNAFASKSLRRVLSGMDVIPATSDAVEHFVASAHARPRC